MTDSHSNKPSARPPRKVGRRRPKYPDSRKELEIRMGRKRLLLPILWEDRHLMAIDKPGGWLVAPLDWHNTSRNLTLAIDDSIRQGAHWASTRGLRMLRPVHRLDAETTGILLLAKNSLALKEMSERFAERDLEKVYWAICRGPEPPCAWTCETPLSSKPDADGLIQIAPEGGRTASTSFKRLAQDQDRYLIEARPLTGRTHQIRVHLLQEDLQIFGDPLYGSPAPRSKGMPDKEAPFPMALRAYKLGWERRRQKPAFIKAPMVDFLKAFAMPSPQGPQGQHQKQGPKPRASS